MAKNFRIFFLVVCLILVGFNAYQLTVKLIPERPITFAGIKFAGINDILKNETRIGYITDADISDDRNLVEFEQAQYMLAPAILELNNTKTRFLIVNCSNDAAAFQKLKEIGAQPLKRNPFGIILAQNPSGLAL